jgi:hypothetical protein
MQIENEKDFPELRLRIKEWRKRFPMFQQNISEFETIIENHIKKYSQSMVGYRQSRSRYHLETAQKEIDAINRVVSTVEKIELMALLHRG